MSTFKTTAAYVSGGIAGEQWGGFSGGKPFRQNLRCVDGFQRGSRKSFSTVLQRFLDEYGEDLREKQYTSDTVIRIERVRSLGPGRYEVHVRERLVREFPDCADLVLENVSVADVIE